MTETLQLSEICEQVYGEPTALLHCHSEDSDDKLEVKMLFREKRRNWYMEMVITQPKNSKKGFSSHRVSPLFLPLLDSKETQWADLTKEATEEDIEAIDQLFILAHQLSNTNIAFAGADVVGEDVAEAALENFGFYVPDETLLPVFIWWNLDYQLKLIAYFKHPDRFAGEIMIQDDNTNESEVYPSLKKSVARLQQKITYYQEEG